MSRARSPNPFPLLEILFLLALGCAAVGLCILLLRGRGEAYKTQCTSNLKQVYSLALGYAQKQGINAYPIGDGTAPAAHESLNKLVDYEGEGLNPKLFICPEGEASAAKLDSSGKFKLSAETLSYSWVKERMRSTTPNRALSSDKYVDGFVDSAGRHYGHRKGMVVLMTDGAASFVPEDELPPTTKLPEGLTR